MFVVSVVIVGGFVLNDSFKDIEGINYSLV
jgi:hypothetical protein